MWTALSHVLKKFIQYLHEGILLEKIHDRLCEYRYRTNFFESIAKRMIKYLLFARSHEIWQREIL